MPTRVKKEVVKHAASLLLVEGNLQNLTEEILTRNYRRLALEFHPDKVNLEHKDTAERAMKEINAANDLLKGFLSGEIIIEANEARANTTREARSYTKASAQDNPQMGLAEASLLVGVGVAVITGSPAIAAALYLTAAAVSAAPAVYIMLNIRSQLLFKRPYQFGDLFLNDACRSVMEYRFGDIAINRAGRAITGNPEYKAGDFLRAGIGLFSRRQTVEATLRPDEEQDAQSGVAPNT